MPQGAHPERHQRAHRSRAALHLLGLLIAVGAPAVFAALIALTASITVAGCDAGSPSLQPVDLPAVNITGVSAATSVSSTGELVFESIQTTNTPPPDVLSTSSFKVRFDRLLLPATANRQAACLSPVLGNVTNYTQCMSGVSFQVTYDPMLREVTFRQTSDNPPLIVGATYTLTIFAAIADTDNGIRSFDGIPVGARVAIEFKVAANPGGKLPPYDLGPQGDHFCTSPYPTCSGDDCPRPVKAVLQSCAYVGCHAGNPDAAAEGMDLSTPASLLATAINRTSHETETGEAASTAQGNSLRFGRAMNILDPGVPGESYLVYKLLANHYTPLVNPFPVPPNAAPGDDAPEVTRLRNGVVVGMPMPPDNAGPTVPLRGAPTNLDAGVPLIGEAEWLSEWLLQGAPVTCP